MAGRYLDLQRPDKQQELLARAVSLAARSDDPEVMACAQCATARAARRVGDAPAAATALAEGRRALARLDRPGLPARVECLRAEAEAGEAEGRGDEAIARLGQARALLEPGVIAGPLYAGVLDDLAGLLHRQGRPRDALAVNLTRVHAFDREGRGGPLARARVVHARAVLLDAVGEVVASEAEARRARELAEEGAGLADASLVLTHARALDRLGRSAEALALLQRLAPDGERRHDAALWPRLRLQTAAALIHAGDLAAAAAPLQEAEQRCAGDPAAHGRDLREARRLRAEIALRAGEPRAAQAWLDRPAPTPASGEAPGDRLAWNRTAARVALARGDAAAAAVRAAEAAQVAEQIARDPAASADVGEALLLQARAARALGRDAEAGALLARAATALAAGLGAEHELARQAREARAPRPGPKA
jgi:hypothetical protein